MEQVLALKGSIRHMKECHVGEEIVIFEKHHLKNMK